MSNYNEGDLVEAVKGDRAIRDRIFITHDDPIFKESAYLGKPNIFGLSSIDSYRRNGFTVTVIERAKPALPTVEGSGIFWNEHDQKGTRVAMRTGSWSGLRWHHQRPGESGTSEYTDEGIRALVGKHKFAVVEPEAVTAKRFAARLHTVVQPKIDSSWYTKATAKKILEQADAIAAEFGVTGGLGE